MDVYSTGKELATLLINVFNTHTLFIVNFNQMAMNVDQCHHFCGQITNRISHLDEDAKGNSIEDDCYAKTEWSTMLSGSQSDSRGTKKHGGVA